jgi:ribonuclease I
MIRFLMPAAFVALLLTPLIATAQDQPQDTPGQFDFYVLSLSW